MPLKLLYNHCIKQLAHSLEVLEIRKAEIVLALESESKSSAGDKHETGRAMIQLEREKLGEQIKKAEKNQATLHQLKQYKSSEIVRFGSAVQTNKANYYIAIATDSYTIKSALFHCISPQSPIGTLLLGKKVGDQLVFNAITSTITAVH
ncbi:GreA/GreB family elongation factor [Flavobacteriaceae bacterium]|nr:GreA/GreB family elongation factor [Flavobacteriaceae bacterium]MDB4152509.1 GreA/GreB family elongation factor [Flavobacteriaceae bacterium]|tara:strand:- start:868 stop:1314 length:447 start_codon:yes stop_codon:yes gene_type:complete